MAPTDYKSNIDCGVVVDGQRSYDLYVEFFGEPVKVFTAENDPQRRILVKPVTLSKKLGWTASRLGMFLHRRKSVDSGIYQATGFLNKPQRPGSRLKEGTYFIAVDTCQEIEERSWRDGDRLFKKGTGATPPLTPTSSVTSPAIAAVAAEAASAGVSLGRSSGIPLVMPPPPPPPQAPFAGGISGLSGPGLVPAEPVMTGSFSEVGSEKAYFSLESPTKYPVGPLNLGGIPPLPPFVGSSDASAFMRLPTLKSTQVGQDLRANYYNN